MKNAIEFNEAFMGAGNPLQGSRIPGFGAGNRTPETSRVHKSRAKGAVVHTVKCTNSGRKACECRAGRKGLARSAVVVIRLSPREYEVRVKGTRALVGMIRKVKGAGGVAYSYTLNQKEAKAHKGFASQSAAVARMLEKV